VHQGATAGHPLHLVYDQPAAGVSCWVAVVAPLYLPPAQQQSGTHHHLQLSRLQAVDQVQWADGFCRRDIGWRALDRAKQPAA
jgi:hypothetical protein